MLPKKSKNYLMKNSLYFLLFITMAPLISCSENEQPPEEVPSLVVGEWFIESLEIAGTLTEANNGQSVVNSYNGHATMHTNSEMIFKEDNTFNRRDSFSMMIHSHINGNHSMELTVIPVIIITGTYHIDGNKIKFVSEQPDGDYGLLNVRASFEGTIIELSENRLEILEKHQKNSNVGGVQIENEYEMTHVFVR